MFLIILSAITVCLLLALKFYTDKKAGEAELAFPAAGQFTEAGDVRLHYVRRGRGKPVVMVHGSFGSANDFLLSVFDDIAAFSDAIAVDRAGHGYSERPEFPMQPDEHAEFIRAGLKKLGVERPLLVGHSLGALVALSYAFKYPQEAAGLVLISPYVTPWIGPTNPIHSLAGVPLIGRLYLRCFVRPLGNWMGKRIGEKVFYPQEAPAEYLERAMSLALRPGHFAANAEDIRGLNAHLKETADRYAQIHSQTLILAGDQDRIAPLERHARPLHKAMQNSELVVLPGVGHQPAISAPERVVEAVRKAVKGLVDNAH